MQWNSDAGLDEATNIATVEICLSISSTEGRCFSKECKTPQELWDLLRGLDKCPTETLQREFNYSGPTEPKPLDIDDILRDIEI